MACGGEAATGTSVPAVKAAARPGNDASGTTGFVYSACKITAGTVSQSADEAALHQGAPRSTRARRMQNEAARGGKWVAGDCIAVGGAGLFWF